MTDTPALDILKTKSAGALGTIAGMAGGALLGGGLGALHGGAEQVDAIHHPGFQESMLGLADPQALQRMQEQQLLAHAASEGALGAGLGAVGGGTLGAIATSGGQPDRRPVIMAQQPG